MVSYKGYEKTIEQVYANKQDHVFTYWDGLSAEDKERLLKNLSDIDFTLLEKLFQEKEHNAALDFEPAPYIGLPKTDDDIKEFEQIKKAGEEHIRQGKTAAFIVAGGQGTRLGFDGPKGKFPTAPLSGKTLFQIHAEKIVKYREKYDVDIPWFIMTSRSNHEETAAYFKDNNYFGIDCNDVFIFPQNMIPSLDEKGKLILESPCTVFKNPDGHGGSLTALYTSGSLDVMRERNIETISYFQVDNPLVKIMDPLFIGFHEREGADISSKTLMKAYAEEKVGVFVRYANNSFGIIEYSDLSDEDIHAVDSNGGLLYSCANPAIHLFRRQFLETVTSGTDVSLPYHRAVKKIPSYHQGGTQEVTGYKFEKFVFDALSLTEKNLILEVLREEEFAPVKNAEGVDSVKTCQKLMSDLHKKWLELKGIAVPQSARIFEISPLVAVEPDDIDIDTELPQEEAILLEREA